MQGHVTISPDGEISGWCFDRHRPQSRTVVDVHLDGRWLAGLLASDWSPQAREVDPEAAYAGFSYHLPGQYLDGRLHHLSVRAVRGGEIDGSPMLWEPKAATPARHTFTLASGQPDGRRSAGGGLNAGSGVEVIFDEHSFNRKVAVRRNRLSHNNPAIGGPLEHRGYRPWPAFVAQFDDHFADARFGGLYRDTGEVWQGATYLINSFAQDHSRRIIAEGSAIAAPADECLLFCNSVKDTFFHWHVDCLAGLVMARSLLGERFVPIGPPLSDWQRASLDLLGERVVEMNEVCRPKRTIVPSHIDGRGIYPDRWVVRLYDRLNEGFNAAAGSRRGGRGMGPKVFISRRDAQHRVLSNEDELWAALQARGFARFIPGEADYAQQIEVFRDAEVIVASHGSALTNMGFCRHRTTVVEILPSDYLNGCFRYLAIALGLRHIWYSTDAVDPFAIDVDDFVRRGAAWNLFR